MTRDNGAEKFLSRDEFGNRLRKCSGNPMWRDGAMTETTAPFQRLADHLAVVGRSIDAERLAERIAPNRASRGAPPDLLELLARRDADGRPAIRVLERLATEAPKDPLAALALLSMLRPELESMRDRLVRGERAGALEAEADALSAAWEVLTRRPPPGRFERVDAIWGEVRRARGVRRRSPFELCTLPEGFDAADGSSDPVVRTPGSLAAAVAAGVLSPRELVLIARTRLEGRSLRAVAGALGRPIDAAYKERRRAEAALRTFLLRYDSEGPS